MDPEDPERLRRWQAQAIEECNIENVLNHALEAYRIINEAHGLNHDLETYEVINQAVDFENSAITMAINSHGLRHEARGINCVDPMSIRNRISQSRGINLMNSVPIRNQISHSASTSNRNFIDQAIDVAIERGGLGLLHDEDLDI